MGGCAIFHGMTIPAKKPEMRPRELKDASGWYVLVQWPDRPLNRLADFVLKTKPNNGLIKTLTIGSGNVSGSLLLSKHPNCLSTQNAPATQPSS
jgi:hypothetical protein